MRNDYTLRWDGKLYQIERQAVVAGCAGPTCGWSSGWTDRWRCAMASGICRWRSARWRTSRRPLARRKRPSWQASQARRGSDWNKNFDLKKAPKIWQAAQASGHRRGEAMMDSCQSAREWREGKVRPIPGNSPHDRPVSRGILSSQGEFATIPSAPLLFRSCTGTILRRLSMRFLRHGGIYLVRCGFQNQNQTLGRDRTASRWSAPRPGKRTRREDHAPSHRPQMSSGRLFLDRVARQQSPSPLHRHTQINTHSRRGPGKRRHFYFARKGTFLLCLDKIILLLVTCRFVVYDIDFFQDVPGSAVIDQQRRGLVENLHNRETLE